LPGVPDRRNDGSAADRSQHGFATHSVSLPVGTVFDSKIFDESRKLVYTWSDGRAFPMIIRDEQFGPGELSYGFSAPLNGTGLPPAVTRRRYISQLARFEISEFLP
jgi:hypothetical protein